MDRHHGDGGVWLSRELAARIRALSRVELEAIAAYKADTSDEYERNPYSTPESVVRTLLEDSEPYADELKRVLGEPSP